MAAAIRFWSFGFPRTHTSALNHIEKGADLEAIPTAVPAPGADQPLFHVHDPIEGIERGYIAFGPITAAEAFHPKLALFEVPEPNAVLRHVHGMFLTQTHAAHHEVPISIHASA
jgi:hypothetical protein